MTVLFRVVDLETSGMEPTDDVVEIGFADLDFDPQTRESTIGRPSTMLFKPRKPLTPEVMAVHHLTDRVLEGWPHCERADLEMLFRSGGPRFLVAHNAAFERKFITDDMIPVDSEGKATVHWICTFKCALRMWPSAGSHGNQAIRYLLGLDLDEADAMPPHRAGPDAFVTAAILEAMLKEQTAQQLVTWTRMPRFYPECPHAKQKGPWERVEISYLKWMAQLPDIEPDLLAAVYDEFNRRGIRR